MLEEGIQKPSNTTNSFNNIQILENKLTAETLNTVLKNLLVPYDKIQNQDNIHTLHKLSFVKTLNYINTTKSVNVKKIIYNERLCQLCENSRMFTKQQRPYLILDIDETLVSSFHVTDNVNSDEINGNFYELKFDNQAGLAKVFLKVRPYANDFIEKLDKYYQLIIYSHGKDFYVEKVARILDPRNKIFNKDNTFSRFGNEQVKSLENIGKKCDDFDFVIFDDSYEVWKDKMKQPAHEKIIVSKKFVAWTDRIDKRKLANLTIRENCHFGEEHQEYFVDRKFLNDDQSYMQLKELSDSLVELAETIRKTKFRYPNYRYKWSMEAILRNRRNSILKNKKTFFLTKDENQTKAVRRQGRILGANEEEDPKNANQLLIDVRDDGFQSLFQKLRNSWGFEADDKDWYSVSYVFDCYFTLKTLNIQHYKIALTVED